MTAVPESEVPCALLVMCSECGRGVEVPLPIDRDALARFLVLRAWFVSILTAPGQTPILFGAVCNECAPKVFSPEVLRAAEERRQKLLQGQAASG
jgi:hypothetical protein